MVRCQPYYDSSGGGIMQTFSETYAPYADSRQIAFKGAYELIDIDAAIVATSSATDTAEIATVQQSHDKIIAMTKKLGTLEPNYFLLDGSFSLPSKLGNNQTGWWSNVLSGADRAFTSNPKVTYTFSTPQSCAGFTLIFDDKSGECASDFTIKTFNGATLKSQGGATDNTDSTCVVPLQSDSFTLCEVEFLKTSKPFRRVRLCELVFGFLQYFNRDNIKSCSVLYETSLTMERLPSSQIQMTIDNSHRQYNLLNPTGIYRFLQQGQGLSIQLGIAPAGGEVEMINMGRFYFQGASAEDGGLTACITATDRFAMLGESICTIGQTGTWTLTQGVAAVIADSRLPITTIFKLSCGTRIVRKCIPKNANHREAIRLLAQAARCVCYFDREDRLCFEPAGIAAVAVDTLSLDRVSDIPAVTDTGRINTVVVTAEDVYAGTKTTYTATNKQPWESELVKSVSNPLANGQEIADWLLYMYGLRRKYDVTERGNPARELVDTIVVYDVYGENKKSLVTKEAFTFDGALSGKIETVGGDS